MSSTRRPTSSSRRRSARSHALRGSRQKAHVSRAVWVGGLYPLLGLLLLPPMAAAWYAVLRLLRGVAIPWSAAAPFLIGVVGYLLFQWAFRKPLGLYVFGHELTHALAAFLSGYRVKSLFASEKGGEVVLSDTNVFVALAPYCVPLYTLGMVGLVFLVRHYSGIATPPAWTAALVGFTYAFHLALTFYALHEHQPDLEHAGVFFSLVVIVLANGLVLLLVLKALSPEAVSLRTFAERWGEGTMSLLRRALAAGRYLMQTWGPVRG